ncbi:hypothetical protein DFQ28_008234 [Apophysomyces sp. BC1034]|nr:hypothetical protein DFQ30_007773 [Apophysomyces sp. BC1015]KAG0175287.1 hypothetical protein DFQ29_007201 [Apophysomyces sp. BC1021]KAG0186166.1 hypothetical protein DFQ28_008234 [Apophysomyces sp. BC1034]
MTPADRKDSGDAISYTEEHISTTVQEYETLPTHRTHTDKTIEAHMDEKHLEDSAAIDMPTTEEYHLGEPESEEQKPGRFSVLYDRHRKWFHLAMWLIFTGFLAAAYALQVPKGYDSENLILGLIYAWFSLYIFFCHVPTTIVTKPWAIGLRVVSAPLRLVSSRVRSILYCAFTIAVIVVTVFCLPESPDSTRIQRLIALFGVLIFLASVFACSNNHRAVNWNTVSGGVLLQFLLALFVFRTSVGQSIFSWASAFARGYLSKAYYGTAFVFGDAVANSGTFAVSVFPTVIFFAATVQVLYYLNSLQWLLAKCAVVFKALLGVSGAESVVAVASPFLGQGENALLVKPFLPHMTNAELHQVMTSGFATISGAVLYGYISMGISPEALLTSCIMSIPCSLAISKLRYPETKIPMTAHEVKVPPSDEKASNLLHAAGNGAAIGMNIALLICANLISLLALLYAVNAGLTWIGNFLNIQNLTLQLITGYIFVPVAWLMGVPNNDLVTVGQLLATKIWANEFVAYQDMMKLVLPERTRMIATYALCGFANLGSVGMQIGVLGTLAPKRAGDISRLAVSAMMCGAISTWVSAAVAGMLI